jgi:organic hydroperoxide reductase OsmC/OhrA
MVEDDVNAKPVYKSFRYANNLVWNSARRGRLSVPGKPELDVGSPPEFKGEPGIWSPEELLVGALNACMMLTFLTLTRSKGVELVGYDSAAEGLLENVDGKYQITQVTVQPCVVLKTQADLEAAQTIMGEVERNCFISNSIKAEIKLVPQLQVSADGAN